MFSFIEFLTNISFSVDGKIEERIAIQALRLNTLSKLTFSDSKRFDALIKDVFPDVTFQDVDYAELQASLIETAKEMGLIVSNVQVFSINLIIFFMFCNKCTVS